MSDTEKNLEEAFAGESKARNKYTFFAEKAEEEGKPGVSKLFRAAALAEKIHARNHFEVLGELKSTEENLKAAIGGENYEHTDMYPEFIEKAEEESEEDASRSFELAMKVEEIHENFYQGALKAVERDKDLEEKDWYVCGVCGNTVEGEAPDQCPVCGVPKSKFIEVD